MRRRLIVFSTIVLSALLLALMLPLLSAYAADRTEGLFGKRLADVNRFSVLAVSAVENDDAGALHTDLQRYEEVHGTTVVILDADRKILAASHDPVDVTSPRLVAVMTNALSGNTARLPRTVWPWRSDPLYVASPIGRDAQILGAVVMVADTESIRSDVSVRLMWFAIAAVLIVGVTAGTIAIPLVGWIIRPVHGLDEAALQFGEGDLSTRVADDAGPPELRHLAVSFNKMADSVALSQRQQRELIADASHQLGNPLTALRLRIEMLRGKVDERFEQPVDQALAEADRLTTIVNSLIELSRIGAERSQVGTVDIADEARQRCELWAPLFGEHLQLDLPDEAHARSTQGLVALTLDALLDNAAKFAPGSTVEVQVVRVEEGIRLVVHDHGNGLESSDLDKVGARFFRGRNHQNLPGTGLGLAIVRAHVADIGGTFDVSSPPDAGLRVCVTFPTVNDPFHGNTGSRPGADPAAT